MAKQEQPRNIGEDSPWASYDFGYTWAVLVGISKYKYSSDIYKWDLDYAHNDAEELAALFTEASYGCIPEDRLRLFRDEKATTEQLTKVLRSFLRKPARKDLVFLHFACHGMKDPDGRDEVYLATYDTNPDDIPGTALPMWEVRHALEATLAAKRVVVLLDTCHAGALILGGRRSVLSNRGVVNNYLQKAGASKPGQVWLMSASANEVSLEGNQWGRGHGLFTYHVLQGLREKAVDTKGLVTAGGLFDYVEEAVRRDSNERQHPEKLGQGDYRDLVIAVTGHLEAQVHSEIGRLLAQMGALLDDRRRYEWAARQFETAAALGRENAVPMHAAAVQSGLVRLALAEGEPALAEFETAIKEAPQGGFPDLEVAADARFYKPVALLDTTRPLGEVLTALDEFLKHHAEDPRAGCAREMIPQIEQAARSRKRALLIGVSTYTIDGKNSNSLPGVLNDVASLQDALIKQLEFASGDVTVLLDSKATRQGIMDALAALKYSGADDVVVIYYGGAGLQGASEAYLFPFDSGADRLDRALRATEIHEWLKAIPASRTIVVLDTDPKEQFVALAREDPSYTLLLAATPGENCNEVRVREGDKEVVYGALTWGLIQAIRQFEPSELTLRKIEARVIEEFHRLGIRTAADTPSGEGPAASDETRMSWPEQTPLFLGDESQPLFGWLFDFRGAFRVSRRRNYAALTLGQVQDLDRRFQGLSCPFPGLRHSLGRAYLELGAIEESIKFLEREPVPPADLGRPHLTLACSYLAAGKDEEARRSLEAARGPDEPAGNLAEREAFAALEAFFTEGRGRRHALLVGINSYLAPGVPNPRGAVADVDALQAVLIERWGFRPGDVTVLTDTAATRKEILEGLRRLTALPGETHCLFVFSGVGSVDSDEEPTLLAADSRQVPGVYDDISLSDLRQFLRDTQQHLVTILDAGWTHSGFQEEDAERLASSRHEPRSAPPRPKTRNLVAERELEGLDLSIGSLTLIDESLRRTLDTGGSEVEVELPDPNPDHSDRTQVRGRLCHGLTSALWRLDLETATGQSWLDAAAAFWTAADRPWDTYRPVVVPPGGSSESLFGEPLAQAVVKALRRVEIAPLAALVRPLQRLVEKQDRPQDFLNLGLACATIDRYDEAILALEQARDHKRAPKDLQAEACYHLGRTLLESGKEDRIDRAIGELRDAVRWIEEQADALKQDRGLAGVYYYLGRALRESARRNLRELSVRAFQKYLDAGAPLGHHDEARRWINPGPAASVAPPPTP